MSGWQDMAAGAIVALAAVAVLWQVWRTVSGRARIGCGHCGKPCAGPPPPIQIELPADASRTGDRRLQ